MKEDKILEIAERIKSEYVIEIEKYIGYKNIVDAYFRISDIFYDDNQKLGKIYNEIMQDRKMKDDEYDEYDEDNEEGEEKKEEDTLRS